MLVGNGIASIFKSTLAAGLTISIIKEVPHKNDSKLILKIRLTKGDNKRIVFGDIKVAI